MAALFHLPVAPSADLWEDHVDGDTDVSAPHLDTTRERRMPPLISPDRDAPISVPSSPQSTYHRASSLAHASRSPPRMRRAESGNPLMSFTSATSGGYEHAGPPPPPLMFVDPWQDEALNSYPESVQSGDYGEKAPTAILAIERPTPTQTPGSFFSSSGSTSNSITKAALASHKSTARENTASWLSRQDAKATALLPSSQSLSPLTQPAPQADGLQGGGRRLAAASDDDVSTIVDVKTKNTNRRSVRVSRGVPRGFFAAGQTHGTDGAAFDTLALHGMHMPWTMQCTHDSDDDGYTNPTSSRGPVSARASSDISMSHILQTDDSGDAGDLMPRGLANGDMRATLDDPLEVAEAEGQTLSFVVLHDGKEGQFWLTGHYLNQLTIADLTRLCLRATADVATSSSDLLATPTDDDVQLHVVLSRQTSAKLGLSMEGAGMNLVPVEAWTFNTFPTMQFLLLKAFFADVADREGFVRLLCSGCKQALPSELTASRQFWHGWNVPNESSLHRRQKSTQTERANVCVSTTTRGVQTPRSPLGAEPSAPSSTAFLRSIRGLSELSSMVSSVERALDSAQESVNATFFQRAEMGNEKPLPPRPLSAPVEHRRTRILTRPDGGLSSRFSEESGRESLDEEPSAILARWKRWNGQRNSGGHASTANDTTTSRRPSEDTTTKVEDSDATSVHSQYSTSSIARRIGQQHRKLAHMASHTVVRFRNQRPAYKRGGSRTSSVGKRRRRAHTIDTAGPSPMASKSTAVAASTAQGGVVTDARSTCGAQKSSNRFNNFLPKPAKTLRRKAPPPAPLDLSRLPRSKGAGRQAQRSSSGPKDDDRPAAVDDDAAAPSDTDVTPSTASAILSRELCARLLQQRAQDDELELAARDVLRSVQDAVVSERPPPMDVSARQSRQSNAVEELDEVAKHRRGTAHHDDSDTHSISSSASFAGSTFAGLRRLFQTSDSSSVTSLALVTPPASPAAVFKSTLSNTTKQVSLSVKSGLTSFRKNRLAPRSQKIQASQIGEPTLLDGSRLPMAVTDVAAEMEPVVITHLPPVRAVSRHASVFGTSPSSSASSSSYDSSVEAAARRPGKPLLLSSTSMTTLPNCHSHRRSPQPRHGNASFNSADTQPGRDEGGAHGKSPEPSPTDRRRRQSSTETAMATWQAYTSAEAARSMAIANDYGASALLSAKFGSTKGPMSSPGFTGTSCDTTASRITTTPLTPPATISRGWRRCDENMEPAMRDCVASLRGFNMGEDGDEEEDTVDDNKQQQQLARATPEPSLSSSSSSKWNTGSLHGRRPSTARSLDMLMQSRCDGATSVSPTPPAATRPMRAASKHARPALIATTLPSPHVPLLDDGGVGEQPQQHQRGMPTERLHHGGHVSGASATAAANAPAKNGGGGRLSRANSFLGRHLPLRRPTTASSSASITY